MKKSLVLIAIMAMAITALNAKSPVISLGESEDIVLTEAAGTTLSGSFPVKKNGKNVGYVSYSVEFQGTSRGIFAHCTFENNTDEWVEVSLYNISNVSSVGIGPWKTKEVTGTTDQIPSKISGGTYCR